MIAIIGTAVFLLITLNQPLSSINFWISLAVYVTGFFAGALSRRIE